MMINRMEINGNKADIQREFENQNAGRTALMRAKLLSTTNNKKQEDNEEKATKKEKFLEDVKVEINLGINAKVIKKEKKQDEMKNKNDEDTGKKENIDILL